MPNADSNTNQDVKNQLIGAMPTTTSKSRLVKPKAVAAKKAVSKRAPKPARKTAVRKTAKKR